MFIKSSKFLVTCFFGVTYVLTLYAIVSKNWFYVSAKQGAKSESVIRLYTYILNFTDLFFCHWTMWRTCVSTKTQITKFEFTIFFCSQLNITCHSMLHETDSLVLRRFSWLWLNWITTTWAKKEKIVQYFSQLGLLGALMLAH